MAGELVTTSTMPVKAGEPGIASDLHPTDTAMQLPEVAVLAATRTTSIETPATTGVWETQCSADTGIQPG